MNRQNLVNYFKDKKLYIISPHFDDALLSAGQLLSLLPNREKITIINCFTAAHAGPYTFSAKIFLKSTSESDALKLYRIRQEEDISAFANLNIKTINLGIEDALFRRKGREGILSKFLPELDAIYPTYRWHVIKEVSSQDYAVSKLKNLLKNHIEKDSYVLAPFGIGGHVDHVITRIASEEASTGVLYYSDFPYNIRLRSFGEPPIGYTKVSLHADREVKSTLIAHYKSQINSLFKNGELPEHVEVFFIK